MNNNENKPKQNGGRFKHNHKRHNHHHKPNHNKTNEMGTKEKDVVATASIKSGKEEKKKVVDKKKENTSTIYTRNLEPLEVGYRLPAMTLFNAEEEEFNLNDDRSIKMYVTIPTFENKAFTNDVFKLDTIIKEFPSLNAYVMSNEPVYTQKRLSKPCHFEKFRILSDFKNREFARNTGTYIYELSQLVKSVFIVDKNERILYVHYYDDLYTNFNLNDIHKTLKEIFD